MKQMFVFGFCIFILAACNNKSNSDTGADTNTNTDTGTYTDWIKGYATYINDNVDTSVYKKYSMCYIDDDDTPELCLFGSCFADGAIILSQNNGKVTQRGCNSFPYYIERSGLIDNGYAHNGLYGDQILQLKDGEFEEILCADAMWYGGDADHPAYFVYKINDQVIDTLYGEDVNDESCPQMNDAIKQAYSSKGNSRALFESPQGVFDISELFK